MRILFNSAKFSAGRPSVTGFFGRNGLYLQHLSFWGYGLLASLKILATENMHGITVKLHIVDYCRQ